MNDDTLSKTEQEDNKEYDSIAKALSEGNHEELDRLMAAEADDKSPIDGKKPEESGDEAKNKDDVQPNKEDKEEDDGKDDSFDKLLKDDEPPTSDNKDEKQEAATSAASPATDKDLEQELHRLRSDAGRVPFLQRRLADLERELRAQKARTPSATVDSKTTSKPANLNDVELDDETREALDELKAVDPILAKTIETMHKKAIYAANSRADHIVDTFTESEREAEEQRFFMEQKAELTRMIPQHETIFAMPEWAQWKNTLTPGQRALAESGYASEVGQAIYAFAADMQRRNGTPSAADTQVPPASPPDKTDVAKARDRKVEAGAEVKNPAAKADEPFDEDKYFSEMYDRERKNSHI